MAKHPPWLETLCLALGLWVGTAPATAGGRNPCLSTAYLHAVGPSELRFQPKPSPVHLALPALISTTPAKTTAASTNSTAGAPSGSAAAHQPPPPTIVTSGPEPPPQPGAPAPLPAGLAAEPAAPGVPVLDQQVLLEYLAPAGTNSAARATRVWPSFVPPAGPQSPRSSQATYESR